MSSNDALGLIAIFGLALSLVLVQIVTVKPVSRVAPAGRSSRVKLVAANAPATCPVAWTWVPEMGAWVRSPELDPPCR